MGVYGLTPYSSQVSSYACHADCQAEGAKDAALLVGLTVATYTASVAVLSAIGEWAATHPDQVAELGGGTEGAVPAADHIVLGMRDTLEQTALDIGGRTLLDAPDWKTQLLQGIAEPSTKITVSMDNVIMNGNLQQTIQTAVQQGYGGAGTPFAWEMSQLMANGRMPTVNFILGGKTLPNPFAP